MEQAKEKLIEHDYAINAIVTASFGVNGMNSYKEGK
jgi:hypothetical protein